MVYSYLPSYQPACALSLLLCLIFPGFAVRFEVWCLVLAHRQANAFFRFQS